MEPGDRFIASTRLYGGAITQFGKTFKKFDRHAVYVAVDDIDAVPPAMTSRTKAIFVERPANPGGVYSDIEALSGAATRSAVPLHPPNHNANTHLPQHSQGARTSS